MIASRPIVIAARLVSLAGDMLGSLSARVHLGFKARPAATHRAPPGPPRLSLADQWVRVSDIILGASAKATEASRCHVSAAQQLDLAQYGLSSLLAELALVMDVGVQPLPATVYVLKVAKPRIISGALAA